MQQVYTGVGKVLSRYTTGKLPKAFKIIPNLSNWEEARPAFRKCLTCKRNRQKSTGMLGTVSSISSARLTAMSVEACRQWSALVMAALRCCCQHHCLPCNVFDINMLSSAAQIPPGFDPAHVCSKNIITTAA